MLVCLPLWPCRGRGGLVPLYGLYVGEGVFACAAWNRARHMLDALTAGLWRGLVIKLGVLFCVLLCGALAVPGSGLE